MIDDSALLSHARVYDPAKARAYYLRTRELKGRRRSAQVTSVPKPARDLSQKGREERLDALKNRLSVLRDLLQQRVEEAQMRSGVADNSNEKRKKAGSDNDKTSPADKKDSGKGGSEHRTAAEKREDAKRAKENREKKNTSPEKSEPSVLQEIEAVKKQIREVEAKLRDAIQRARQQRADKSKSPTASKGR